MAPQPRPEDLNFEQEKSSPPESGEDREQNAQEAAAAADVASALGKETEMEAGKLATSPEEAVSVQREEQATTALTGVEDGVQPSPGEGRIAMEERQRQMREQEGREKRVYLDTVEKMQTAFRENVSTEAQTPLEGTLEQRIPEADKRQRAAEQALKDFDALKTQRDQFANEGDFEASDDSESRLSDMMSAILDRFGLSPDDFEKMKTAYQIDSESLCRNVLGFLKNNADHALVSLRIEKGDVTPENIAQRVKEGIPDDLKRLRDERRSGEITAENYNQRYSDLDDEKKLLAGYMDIAFFGDSARNFDMTLNRTKANG